jgi:hypothetical protein
MEPPHGPQDTGGVGQVVRPHASEKRLAGIIDGVGIGIGGALADRIELAGRSLQVNLIDSLVIRMGRNRPAVPLWRAFEEIEQLHRGRGHCRCHHEPERVPPNHAFSITSRAPTGQKKRPNREAGREGSGED